jgi:hypothetical protein
VIRREVRAEEWKARGQTMDLAAGWVKRTDLDVHDAGTDIAGGQVLDIEQVHVALRKEGAGMDSCWEGRREAGGPEAGWVGGCGCGRAEKRVGRAGAVTGSRGWSVWMAGGWVVWRAAEVGGRWMCVRGGDGWLRGESRAGAGGEEAQVGDQRMWSVHLAAGRGILRGGEICGAGEGGGRESAASTLHLGDAG